MRQQLSSFKNRFDDAVWTGLHDLIREHAHILTFVGSYQDLVRTNAEVPRLVELIEKIIEQFQEHCLFEEALLQNLGHASLPLQHEVHSRIIAQLTDFRDGMVAGMGLPTNESVHLLDSLIVHHFHDEGAANSVEELASWLGTGMNSGTGE